MLSNRSGYRSLGTDSKGFLGLSCWGIGKRNRSHRSSFRVCRLGSEFDRFGDYRLNIRMGSRGRPDCLRIYQKDKFSHIDPLKIYTDLNN